MRLVEPLVVCLNLTGSKNAAAHSASATTEPLTCRYVSQFPVDLTFALVNGTKVAKMRHVVHPQHSTDKQIKRTLRLPLGEAVCIMWGVTTCWVVIGSLIPAISQDTTTAICVTILLASPTCCMNIAWIITKHVERVRIENAPKLDALLSIAVAFAAGRITERQLHEDREDVKDRTRNNVLYLDNVRMRRPVPPTPPADWTPPEGYGNGASRN